jgi:hypothetical protein
MLSLGITLSAQPSSSMARDGGMYSHIDGLYIPAIPNAPFSARVDAVWSETLKDGTRVTRKFYNLVGRDASGRIHQEDRKFIPAGPNADSALNSLIIKDPIAQTKTTCYPKKKLCEITVFDPAATKPESAAGSQVQREDLGWKTIDSLEAQGTREIRTFKTAATGNDHPLVTTKEIWYSPGLQINLSVVRTDPLFGIQDLKVSQISLSEPAPSFFQVPGDSRIVDER